MKRVLWVGKAPADGAAGDEVYDRRIISALRGLGVEVDLVHPDRVGRVAELANLARGLPHYRAQYASTRNARKLLDAARGHELAIVSWEPFDMLAWGLPVPAIPILHNITSRSLPSMFPASPAANLLALTAGWWQRRAYGSGRFPAVVVLARDDEAYVKSIAPHIPVVYAPPGPPPLTQLAADARFLPELVLLGTYDWRPKRRDVVAFARAYARMAAPWPVYADGLPDQAAQQIRPRPTSALDFSSAARIGVVPDTFIAGHKLKVGAYVANNLVPVAMGDLQGEYAGLAPPYLFDKAAAADLPAIVSTISASFQVDAWRQLQSAFAEAFDWSQSAARILAAAVAAVALRRRA